VLQVVRGLRAEAPQASIAVLVSARTHAAPIARALRAGGIAVQGVDLIPLGEVPVVQDLMALTRALLDPVDRAAAIAMLRAPWCGLSLGGAGDLFEGAPQATLGELLDDDLRRQALGRGLPRAPAARRCRARWGAPAARPRAARGRGRDGLARTRRRRRLRRAGAALDARRFLDAFAEREQSGEWEGIGDLGPLVARLFAASDTGAADAVQVMTIHRAKGLEFDAVILPSLGRARRRGDEPLLSYVEWPDEAQGAQLLLAPIRAPESTSRRRSAPGSGRCTSLPRGPRARAPAVRRGDPRPRRALPARLARREVHGAASRCRGPVRCSRASGRRSGWPSRRNPEPGTDPPAARAARSPVTSMRVAQPWRRPSLEALALGADTLEVATAELPAAGESALRAGPMTRHVGLVVHDELCRLASRLADPAIADAAGDHERWRRLLAAQGVGLAELDVLGARVAEALGRVLADPRGRWLLDARHRDAGDAVALSGLYEGRFTSVRIDRCFVDEEGSRWLDRLPRQPAPGRRRPEAFVAAELRASEARLRRHAALARALGPEPVRVALYFPLLPRLVEFDLRR
jgi:ATP-dependent helicase/nuclease subunit A